MNQPNKVNFQTLTKDFASSHNISYKSALSVISDFINIIQENLISGNQVKIGNLFTLSIAKTKARAGRNPSTGQPLEIKEGKSLKIKSSISFKKLIAESKTS